MVGTCNILVDIGEFLLGGFNFLSTIMVSVVVLLWVGNFELDLTSHLFYKCSTVVSTTLLYRMNGKRFTLFFLPPGL